MRVIALLALIFGFVMQTLLDGQVFTHAVLGILCGVVALGGGMASAKRDRRHRWEGWIMAGLGFALGVWCMAMLPSAYRQQERFNNRIFEYREKNAKQQVTPNKSVERNRRPATPLDAGWMFLTASCAPPFLSAAVAHL